jgi:NAD(P) transhydrogenase subunit alpha
MVNLFVPKETGAGETRVAATPESTRAFIKAGMSVSIERGAGEGSFMTDGEYQTAGATIVSRGEGFAGADIVAAVGAPPAEDVARMKGGAILIAMRAAASPNITTMSMERIPRTTKAQTMDALSSQASIAGYKAALIAATQLPRYFPLLMTAAGTIKPAKLVVMGAGVAGLQALATARRLGAVVEVSDIRPAVKEQVHSLGGRFIDLPMQESGEGAGGYAKEVSADFLRQQREIITRHVAGADAVITTAQVPGRKAPVLVTREMVEGMRPGSIIIDLAVDSGGNCELSKPGETVHNGVRILGMSNLPATMPHDASLVYARNIQALVFEFVQKGELKLNMENEIIRETVVKGNA